MPLLAIVDTSVARKCPTAECRASPEVCSMTRRLRQRQARELDRKKREPCVPDPAIMHDA